MSAGIIGGESLHHQEIRIEVLQRQFPVTERLVFLPEKQVFVGEIARCARSRISAAACSAHGIRYTWPGWIIDGSSPITSLLA